MIGSMYMKITFLLQNAPHIKTHQKYGTTSDKENIDGEGNAMS